MGRRHLSVHLEMSSVMVPCFIPEGSGLRVFQSSSKALRVPSLFQARHPAGSLAGHGAGSLRQQAAWGHPELGHRGGCVEEASSGML